MTKCIPKKGGASKQILNSCCPKAEINDDVFQFQLVGCLCVDIAPSTQQLQVEFLFLFCYLCSRVRKILLSSSLDVQHWTWLLLDDYWFQILFFTVLPNGNIVCVKFPCQCPNDRTCKILSSLSELSWGHQGEITVTAMIWSLWWKDSDSTHPVFKSGLALDNGIWPWHASRGTNSVRI